MRRWLAVACLAVTALAGWPTGVDAHAVLLRVDPPTGRALPAAPREVRLLFSEPIDASFSHVQVVDDAGRSVDRGDARVDPEDTNTLLVSLPAGLPNGVYMVRWRSLSTIDIHPGSGQYPLFVGVPTTTAAVSANIVQNESTPATTVARWWLYLAASGLAGALAAWKFAFGKALVDEHAPHRETALRRVERLAAISGVLLLLGTLFAAVAQAAAAAGVPLEQAVGAPLRDLLTRGRYASIWWPRLGISAVAVAIVLWRGLDDAWSESAAAMVPAILLTNSLTSHAATLPAAAIVGIVADWLHVIGAAVWVGGLASLAVLAPLLARSSGPRRQLLSRFTRLALVGVLVIAASGVVQAVLQVGTWSALVGTAYGIGVLVKVGLLASMLLLAVLNRFGFDRDGASLTRGVGLELALGVLALAVAAVLTGTAPAWQAS